MDNGLIFPYPLSRAHIEPPDTKTFESLRAGPSGLSGGLAVDLMG
jgi:hypothetical protein